MVCKTIKPKSSRVCIGNLNKKIKIQFSSSVPNNAPNTNAGTAFTDVVSVWAMIDTNPNNEFMNGVNTINGVNTDFYIRYTTSIDLSKQIWVEYASNRFKITGVENMNKEDLFIRLRATEKGNKSIAANQR